MKKLLALLAALVMLCGFALAEGEFPELNEKGFLDEGEFLYENADDGVWRYVSPTLKVEIIRYVQKSPSRIWYEAEVWTDGTELFRMIPADPEDRMGGDEWPYMIARENDVVLAINAVLGQAPEGFILESADMNGDGQVMVNDVVLMINVVLGVTPASSQVRQFLNMMQK